MRNRPLPNRHAWQLDNFFQGVQATLNRHRNKPDLDTLSLDEIQELVREEYEENIDELQAAEFPQIYKVDPRQMEREAFDGAVAYFAVFLKARKMIEEQAQAEVKAQEEQARISKIS